MPVAACAAAGAAPPGCGAKPPPPGASFPAPTAKATPAPIAGPAEAKANDDDFDTADDVASELDYTKIPSTLDAKRTPATRQPKCTVAPACSALVMRNLLSSKREME